MEEMLIERTDGSRKVKAADDAELLSDCNIESSNTISSEQNEIDAVNAAKYVTLK